MIVHVDTSALVDACSGARSGLSTLQRLVDAQARLAVSTLALYEWWRGPRSDDDLQLQARLFPVTEAVSFGVEAAEKAAELYRAVRRPRGRDVDLAIAACAIVNGATLWTLNRQDFADVPGLRLL